jgi:hypothetical protein
MYTYCVRCSQFVKDYQKDSYNIKEFIEKNIDDKNILPTLKRNS